jgi:hypothetical protein
MRANLSPLPSHRRAALFGVALLYFGPCCSDANAQANDMSKYFGTWVDADSPAIRCKPMKGRLKGFAIGLDSYVPYLGGFCDNVRTFMHGNQLRVSANCVKAKSSEYVAVTDEFELIGAGQLRVVDTTDIVDPFPANSDVPAARKTYRRCSDCPPGALNCVFGP